MKKVFLISTLIIILSSCANEEKYDSCIKSCDQNASCLESQRISEGNYFCAKWNTGECKNICVKKYK